MNPYTNYQAQQTSFFQTPMEYHQDHGDYYAMGPVETPREESTERASTSMQYSSRRKQSRPSDSLTKGQTRSRHRPSLVDRSYTQSRSRTRSRTSSRSRTRSRTRSRSRARSRSGSHHRNMTHREPSFLDAFRVLFLTPSKHKNSSMHLATKKRQDHIEELLKKDGLGSKRWLFYPKPLKINKENSNSTEIPTVDRTRISDQRIKVDASFFNKLKRSRSVDPDAPILKLKRWELILYKKLGFIQAI